jgi:hypothetical protein
MHIRGGSVSAIKVGFGFSVSVSEKNRHFRLFFGNCEVVGRCAPSQAKFTEYSVER